jgi:hypothetical protein
MVQPIGLYHPPDGITIPNINCCISYQSNFLQREEGTSFELGLPLPSSALFMRFMRFHCTTASGQLPDTVLMGQHLQSINSQIFLANIKDFFQIIRNVSS